MAPSTQPAAAAPDPTGAEWWRSAVIYQIYPRSFADSDGDGIGDLPGIAARLPYLARLGVDAVWLSPLYRSPQADAGYDVADYRAVDPLFGTLEDFDRLLRQAHAAGLQVIVDLVPHTSDEYAWFKAAVSSRPGSPERARHIFRELVASALKGSAHRRPCRFMRPDEELHLFARSIFVADCTGSCVRVCGPPSSVPGHSRIVNAVHRTRLLDGVFGVVQSPPSLGYTRRAETAGL